MGATIASMTNTRSLAYRYVLVGSPQTGVIIGGPVLMFLGYFLQTFIYDHREETGMAIFTLWSGA